MLVRDDKGKASVQWKVIYLERSNAMHENEYQEVYFHDYCEKCKHKDLKEVKDPCHECLSNPVNLFTHKPVKFEAAK